jgi:hypothetical protein
MRICWLEEGGGPDRTLAHSRDRGRPAHGAGAEPAAPRSGKIELPTSGSGGLRAGVDLDDSASLLEAMESPDAAP